MKSVLLVCLSALFALSCEDEKDDATTQDEAYYAGQASISSGDSHFTATAQGGIVAFNASGGQVIVNVDCGTEWTATTDGSDWFETYVSLEYGTLTIIAEKNTAEKSDEGEVTLMTAASGIVFATVTVTRKAYGEPEIIVETNEWHAPAVGALTVEIGVDANASWQVENDCAWLAVEKGDAGITITAEENTDTEERRATLTLVCSDGVAFDSETISVLQDGRVWLKVEDESFAFDSAASSRATVVESNFDWDCSRDASAGWLSVSRGGDVLTVSVTKNETGEPRESEVLLTAGDGLENVAEARLVVSQSDSSDEALILVYTTKSANTTVTLPLEDSVNCTVDWGDGSGTETVTSKLPTHTYSASGEWKVAVSGTVTALNSQDISADDSALLTEVRQWGRTGLKSLQNAFYRSGITSVPADTDGSFSDVTTFYGTFWECESLQSLPSGLFDHCEKAESLYACFYKCRSLTTIPDGLFDHCQAVTNGDWIFGNCTSLTAVPAGLFDNCPNITSFNSVFYDCVSLRSIPSGLFANCPKAADFYYAFGFCSSLTSVPERVFAGCSSATNFEKVFKDCSSLVSVGKDVFDGCTLATTFTEAFAFCNALTSIPENLFSSCTAATLFSYVFNCCYSLSTVPANIFEGCRNITTFESAFYSCVSLKELPKGFFDSCTGATDFYDTFCYCSSLTSLPDGLFSNTRARTLYNTFYGCESLEAIPAGLFSNCTTPTDFTRTFYQCTALTSIPTGLFDDCGNVTTFEGTFGWCTALPSIPANLFANCRKVTSFNQTFYNAASLTGESAYDEFDGIHVHLYERMDEAYRSHYEVSSVDVSKCYGYCVGLSDYGTMPDGCKE